MQLFIGLPRGGVQAVEASLEQTVACVVSAATDAPSTSYGCDVVSALCPGRPRAPLCNTGNPHVSRVQRVVCRGRTLDPRATLAAAGVGTGSTLELLPRLRGGGGDGGSTGAESRSCYLEMYAGKRRDKVGGGKENIPGRSVQRPPPNRVCPISIRWCHVSHCGTVLLPTMAAGEPGGGAAGAVDHVPADRHAAAAALCGR